MRNTSAISGLELLFFPQYMLILLLFLSLYLPSLSLSYVVILFDLLNKTTVISYYVNLMIDWLIDWFIYWMNDLSIDRSIARLIDWLIDCVPVKSGQGLGKLLIGEPWTQDLFRRTTKTDQTARMRRQRGVFAERTHPKEHLNCKMRKTYHRTCAPSEYSDQLVHGRSLIRIFSGLVLDRYGCRISLCG